MAMALIVHGGAGDIHPGRHDLALTGCRDAALAGWDILKGGGSALDAAMRAVVALEDNPNFNAGTGSTLSKDGVAELDAGMMDGATLDVGAIASVTQIKNPILLARLVLKSPHVLLMGQGAELFAQEEGMALCRPEELVTAAQRERWRRGYQPGDGVGVSAAADGEEKHGTVGAVAIDSNGHIAAATSTGGMANKHPGRIGDSPLVGCGFYAEDDLGGVSSTGHGEYFVRLMLARRACEFLAHGMSARAAAEAAIRLLGERLGGTGGLILIDRQGQVGFAHNTPHMSYGYLIEGMETPLVGIE
ncbi:MAG TPA: isoaspartyl peptidase/L-asparaginase [Ktedonobacterales bacterium]|nr:isoaspartyl peptidase/L-asparaginase [Ktedonobacterales bacterium]